MVGFVWLKHYLSLGLIQIAQFMPSWALSPFLLPLPLPPLLPPLHLPLLPFLLFYLFHSLSLRPCLSHCPYRKLQDHRTGCYTQLPYQQYCRWRHVLPTSLPPFISFPFLSCTFLSSLLLFMKNSTA